MIQLKSWLSVAALSATIAISGAAAAQPMTVDQKIDALTRRLEAAEARITAQEDVEAIRKLAFTYGYYMDNALYDQVKTLFSPNIVSCEVSGYGVYKGIAGCQKLWGGVVGRSYGGAEAKMAFGELHKHYLVKDVITLGDDGRSATGRFDYINNGGTFGDVTATHHELGVYNFNFVKEDGVWKIGKFWLVFDTINFNDTNWAVTPKARCPKSDGPKPDGPVTPYHPFPESSVVPFQWNNPVTGKPVDIRTTETHYWIGNWPGEWGGPCGKRSDLVKGAPVITSNIPPPAAATAAKAVQ